jgi:hypothetical protein
VKPPGEVSQRCRSRRHCRGRQVSLRIHSGAILLGGNPIALLALLSISKYNNQQHWIHHSQKHQDGRLATSAVPPATLTHILDETNTTLLVNGQNMTTHEELPTKSLSSSLVSSSLQRVSNLAAARRSGRWSPIHVSITLQASVFRVCLESVLISFSKTCGSVRSP